MKIKYLCSWAKPSGKLSQWSAIFWNYLGMFREYGQKNNYFRNKTFLFFKIESWNFQHLFENEFRETSQSFNSSALSDNCYLRYSLVCLIEFEFCEVSKKNFQQMLRVSASYLEKQKSSIPKKYFLGCSQY